MYYYGYGNGCYNGYVTPCYPTYSTGYGCGCNNGVGGFGGNSATGWIAIILVVFLILVICGFTRNNC